MSYPYPSLVPLLQFYCKPEKYDHVTAPHTTARKGINTFTASADYWRVIPNYTYAWCPVCHARYQEPADTYSIRGWGSYNSLIDTLYVVSTRDKIPSRCPHFFGIHVFLNLQDNLPTEVEYLENRTGEIPYITPWYFINEIDSYAVLHALPICKTENNEFVPRYIVYSLTYFTRDIDALAQYLTAQAKAKGVYDDPEYYPATVSQPGSRFAEQDKPTSYNLRQWADRGQLGWLDITKSDQPLCLGKGEQLPDIYKDIKGKRWPYIWREGRIHSKNV